VWIPLGDGQVGCSQLMKRNPMRGWNHFVRYLGSSTKLDEANALGCSARMDPGRPRPSSAFQGSIRPARAVLVAGYNVHLRPKLARQFLGLCDQEETLDSDLKDREGFRMGIAAHLRRTDRS
jgi:hypothetical protein